MQLSEDELTTLARTVKAELARRNLRIQHEPATGQEKKLKQTLASSGKKTDQPATSETNALRINAIRAAFKAGVKPSTIARQFGVSRSAIQQALSDKADR